MNSWMISIKKASIEAISANSSFALDAGIRGLSSFLRVSGNSDRPVRFFFAILPFRYGLPPKTPGSHTICMPRSTQAS